MDQLINQILKLQESSEPLEPTKEKRDEMLAQVQLFTNQFLSDLDSLPAYTSEKASIEKLNLKANPDLKSVLEDFDSEVVQKGIKPASGGHVGYIPGGGIYTSALGDYLASVTNEYAGMHFASPGAVAMENELLDWIKEIFGFPQTAIGNLTSGGSIANMIALTAARDKFGIRNEKIRESVIYASPQIHHCVLKALRIIGLEDVRIQLLELDDRSKIKMDFLDKKLKSDFKSGLNPFMIIASAGTTDTGAVDPLNAIGKLAKENDLWFHVDGAYGGFFVLCDEKKEIFKGIEMADSLVIDPHKSLFLPYGIGAVLVKDKKAVYHSHHYTANYMQDALDDQLINPADVSPELTKHFRALRMWLPLKLHGIEPFVACLSEKLLLTHYFRNKLEALNFCLGPEPDLTVSYFWYPTKEVNQNSFNEKLMEYIHEDGSIFLSSTMVEKKFVIRLAVCSFRTKLTTINAAIQMISTCLVKTKKEFGIQ